MKILISAYACEPNKGSEPGVGWNVVTGLARHHQVWALVRACHRPAIQAMSAPDGTVNGVNFVFYDGSYPDDGFKPGYAAELRYHRWQQGLYEVAKPIHDRVGFDLVHHVTYVRYWTPSTLWRLNLPMVFGPVGGAEEMPLAFMRGIGAKNTMKELIRNGVQRVMRFHPDVVKTIRRSNICLATTREAAKVLGTIGARDVRISGESALSDDDLSTLSAIEEPAAGPVRFVSMGRLLAWKGFHLGLEAFAASGLDNAEYWIVGDGPESLRLKQLAERYRISKKVRFWGALDRSAALEKLSASHVLVHPSLHDSGGWVCLEAMAAARPVICLDTGGPATQVADGCGLRIPVSNPSRVVAEMGAAMRQIALNPGLRSELSANARRHCLSQYSWSNRIAQYLCIYEQITPTKLTSSVGVFA